uniref:Uncharacterized protein n=1 Tax=Arundo donax TaxID=35708 RepID=A0A0A8YZD1_ARUDO
MRSFRTFEILLSHAVTLGFHYIWFQVFIGHKVFF